MSNLTDGWNYLNMAEGLLLWAGVLLGALFVLMNAARYLIQSCERIGLSWGISPFVVGVLLLAIGTSLPELIVGILSAFRGAPEIVVGNIVGASISNTLLVMGLGAVLSRKPVRVVSSIISTDLNFLLAAAGLFTFSMLDGALTEFEAVVGLCMFIVYLAHIRWENTQHPEMDGEASDEAPRVAAKAKDYIICTASLGGLYFGAEYIVEAILQLSRLTTLGREFISITLLSFGTTLPELVVSIRAIRQGQGEMALGSVLGSCIFNLLGITGVAGLITPLPMAEAYLHGIVPYLIVAILLSFFLTGNRRFNRWEGLMLLLFYAMFLREVFLQFAPGGA